MYDPFSGRFVSNEGGVAGYADRMRCKYHAKWGVQMAGMNFQTCSGTAASEYSGSGRNELYYNFCLYRIHTEKYLKFDFPSVSRLRD